MPLLDLDEVDGVAASHPLWSARRRRPGAVPPRATSWATRRCRWTGPCATWSRPAARRAARRPGGPAGQPAHLGLAVQPHQPLLLRGATGGRRIERLVAEVQNTPWHERTAYVVGGTGPSTASPRPSTCRRSCPWRPTTCSRYRAPGPSALPSHSTCSAAQSASSPPRLALRRRASTVRPSGGSLWANPLPTHRVSAGIYGQAARLEAKGAPFFAHPSKRRRRPAGPVSAVTRHRSRTRHRRRHSPVRQPPLDPATRRAWAAAAGRSTTPPAACCCGPSTAAAAAPSS